MQQAAYACNVTALGDEELKMSVDAEWHFYVMAQAAFALKSVASHLEKATTAVPQELMSGLWGLMPSVLFEFSFPRSVPNSQRWDPCLAGKEVFPWKEQVSTLLKRKAVKEAPR